MADFVTEAKLTELEKKIPDIINLATNTTLTTVENKIPDVSNLVKKTDYNTKVTEIETKLNNHNHGKYLVLDCRILTEKLLQIKQNTYLLKMN